MIGQSVVLEQITMRFGSFTAVQAAHLTIQAGEFFSFLGPSGCGKTTLLRLISGFIEPSAGAVRIGDRDMRGISPNRRPTALIFQNLALFPLMPVWENIAFGLEARGIPKAQRYQRAEALLELVDLPGQGRKLVSQLSGGQKQRVAIARALAVEPAVLLLDEPLSALDLKLRQRMRSELRTIQQKTGVTFIYITHDQGEALTMSDRLAVMRQGVIEQVGTPDVIYNQPATGFVASFVGENNRFAGCIRQRETDTALVETELGQLRCANPQNLALGESVTVFCRPEHLHWAQDRIYTNTLRASVIRLDFEGAFINVHLQWGNGSAGIMQLANTPGQILPQVGEALRCGFETAVALAGGVADD